MTVIDLYLCGQNVTIEANGNDTTDLDYNLYDYTGTLLHFNSDTHDDMSFGISLSQTAGSCYLMKLEATNLGNTYNDFLVTLIE